MRQQHTMKCHHKAFYVEKNNQKDKNIKLDDSSAASTCKNTTRNLSMKLVFFQKKFIFFKKKTNIDTLRLSTSKALQKVNVQGESAQVYSWPSAAQELRRLNKNHDFLQKEKNRKLAS